MSVASARPISQCRAPISSKYAGAVPEGQKVLGLNICRFRCSWWFVSLLKGMKNRGTLGLAMMVDFSDKFLFDKKYILYGKNAICIKHIMTLTLTFAVWRL